MNSSEEIVNRVAASGLVTFDLEDYYSPGDRVVIDIKDQLFQGLILKEKDFREYVRSTDWSAYRGKFVAITCSTDAIVPVWAFMLVAIAVQPYAARLVFGNLRELETALFQDALARVDWNSYAGARVVIKGCSKVDVPHALYIDVAARLRPLAASLMFGEPCSTVPLYKNKEPKK